jgi:hypothetical protein
VKVFKIYSNSVSFVYVVANSIEEAVEVWNNISSHYQTQTPRVVELLGEAYTP